MSRLVDIDASRSPWLRALSTARIVVLGIVVALVAVVCIRLGMWQFDRAGIRADDAAAQQFEALATATPVAIDEVLAPQSTFESEHFARRVELRGHFDPQRQFVVPQRHVDGTDAALVVTAFVVDGGPHHGAVMPVLRGWLPEDQVMVPLLETGTTHPEVTAPPPPPGELRIVGLLNSSEAARNENLPPGARAGISAGQLANEWSGALYSGYLVLEEPQQPGGISPAPSPLSQIDTGVNYQSLAYAVEWWVFALFAIAFWLKVYRDDVADLRRRETSPPLEDPAAVDVPVPTTSGRHHDHT